MHWGVVMGRFVVPFLGIVAMPLVWLRWLGGRRILRVAIAGQLVLFSIVSPVLSEPRPVPPRLAEEKKANSKDDAAFAKLLARAKRGEKYAQYKVAAAYLNGRRIQKDEKKAFYWFRRSVLAGYEPAQYSLACAYFHAEGVKRNFDKAFFWMRKAASIDTSYPQLSLFGYYDRGIGVRRNKVLAGEWLMKGIENRFRWARKNGEKFAETAFLLAEEFNLGLCTPPNLWLAAAYFDIAARAGHPYGRAAYKRVMKKIRRRRGDE